MADDNNSKGLGEGGKSERLTFLLKNGNSSAYSINENLKISFKESNLVVSTIDSETEYSMDDIRKVVFGQKEVDANGDGKVDAIDVVDIVNHMMGKPTSTGEFDEIAADANEDGLINAADVVKVTNIIMGE